MARSESRNIGAAVAVFFWAAVLFGLLWLAIDSNHFKVASHTVRTANTPTTTTL
jgi:hypothetical protein